MASSAADRFAYLKQGVQRAVAGSDRRLASPLVPLAIVLLCVFAYTPPRWQDWNQNSRFNLTRAIVDDGTVRIDRYAGNTGDYALIDGHKYSDKAPGLSLMAVPAYIAVKALEPIALSEISTRIASSESYSQTLNPDGEGVSRERTDTAVALYAATLVTVSIPAVAMLVLLALLVERLAGCRTAGILAALCIGLATPVFSYSQAFYGHVPAAACIVGVLALIILRDSERLSPARLMLIGALAGWAVVIEYPAAVVLLPIGLWLVYLERERALLFGLLGTLPPLAALTAYDLVAFGTILPIGYEHSALWQEQHSTGFMSLTYPRLDALWGLSFSRFRGLFLLAPVLLLAIPGLPVGLRHASVRAVYAVVGFSFVAFFLFASSSAMWWGGFAAGPRYLVPAVPLLALPLGATIAWVNRRPGIQRLSGLLLVAVFGIISAALTWATTFAGQNYPPDTIRDPLSAYVSPALTDGDIARNLGMALHLNGLASLIPLAFITVLGTAFIGMRLVSSPASVTS
jgi:hypothetical protein